MTMQENVANGARFLDEHIPNWFELIDVDTLYMETGCDCIRGQLERNIDPELVHSIISGDEDSYLLYPVELGFVLANWDDSWIELKNEWVFQIVERKRQSHG